jgi:hypothetical protein
MGRPEVLLIGEFASPDSELAQRLAAWGAQCNFANSWEQICKLLGERSFDLVVCEGNLGGDYAVRAVPLLVGSPTTLFYSFPVEDSCLWIQVLEKGCTCAKPHAWRPDEFAQLVRQALKDET